MAKHAVAEEDRCAIRDINRELEVSSEDPVQSLEGLDVAGPKQL